MPQMANITVKKADGVTDIILVQYKAAAGDGSQALWRVDAGFPNPAVMPTVTYQARNNGPRTARRHSVELVYPYSVTNTTTGVVSEVSRVVIKDGSIVIPLNIPQAVVNEAVALYQGFAASVLFRDCLRSGFAPT